MFAKLTTRKTDFFTENMVLKTDFPGINDRKPDFICRKENGFFEICTLMKKRNAL